LLRIRRSGNFPLVGPASNGNERDGPFPGDYRAQIDALQKKLAHLQFAQIVHKKRAMVLFEGWEGAGKLAALRRLTARWDPCHFRTWCVRQEDFRDTGQHWLAAYWGRLPEAGDTALYFRSWYNGLVRARALGEMSDKKFLRALDEINEFEAQQAEHGTLLVKLFFDVSAQVQAERLHERASHPWRRFSMEPEDLHSHSARDGYQAAWDEMFAHCDTRWAPWRVIDGNDKRSCRIAALAAVAEALEGAVPAEPPTEDERVAMLALRKFG
jgi:AMP-polyphosphate phosphotransferase